MSMTIGYDALLSRTSPDPKPIKLLICWQGTSGYLSACWRALVARPEVSVQIVTCADSAASAPFSREITAGLPCEVVEREKLENPAWVHAYVAQRSPEAVVISGWNIDGYRALPFGRGMEKVKFCMGMDTPWRNTWRQKFARLKIGRYLDRMDRVLVTGERSYLYARHLLKVPEGKIRRAMYGIDYAALAPIHEQRDTATEDWPRRFLFIGRYQPVKGIDVLVEGYQRYRARHSDAWRLTCCGAGPLANLFEGIEGIENRGFVQPADQPALWKESGVFVLASRFDPWPLVVVEAAASGLPVICTESCGSASEIVRSFYNGLVVPTDDAGAIAGAMSWAHTHHDQLSQMGKRGQVFAGAYSAQVWAQRWVDLLQNVTARLD